MSFGTVAGMTLASNRILYGSSADGILRSVPFADGQVTGGPTTLSTDGSWRHRTIFVGEGSAPQNQPPTAMAAGSCAGLTCEFIGSGSDPEGGPLDFSWEFGDGESGSGTAPSHTYDAPDDYLVTLTVTDAAGATATSTVVVEAAQENRTPIAAFTFDCAELTCTFDASGSDDPDGDELELAWNFGDGATESGSTAARTYETAGTFEVTLTATDPLGAVDTLTRVVEAGAGQAGEITPVGVSSVNRNSLTFAVTVPTMTEEGDAIILFLSENKSGTEVTGPGPGWSQLGAPVVDNSSKTSAWYRVAQADDAGDQVTVSADARTKAAATLLVYRGGHPDSPVGAWAGAAKQGNSTVHETPSVDNTNDGAWRLSYWAVKSSSITTLTGPSQEVVRDATTGSGGGRILTLVTDGGEPEGPGSQGGLVAQSDTATGMASTWTLMLRPDQE